MSKMAEKSLGPPPWSDDELRHAYFHNFESAYRAIDELAGAQVERALSGTRFSVNLLFDSADDLLLAVSEFKTAAENPMLWSRVCRTELDLLERKIRKALFGVTSASLALVDHARRTSGDFVIDDYDKKLRETFDQEQHRFVQGLRNFATHVSIVTPEWQQIYTKRQNYTELLLTPELLLVYKKWTVEARKFIDRHPAGIKLDELFSDYRNRVATFYCWYLPTLENQFQTSLQEYRRYRQKLDQFGHHSFWTMLLSQVVISRKLDPYEYLDRYLSETELQEVRSLPDRSRPQVDRIISLIDESGACDDRLRELVYQAFHVNT